MEDKVIQETKWLTLKERHMRTPDGEEKSWTFVERKGTNSAVCAIARLQRDGEPCVVLIRQFRPSAQTYLLEFPAGLVDEGESATEAALRELEEETGFYGTARETSPMTFSSAGLTSETIAYVTVDVEGQREHQREEDENIEVLVVPVPELYNTLSDAVRSGDCQVDARLWGVALGWHLHHHSHMA